MPARLAFLFRLLYSAILSVWLAVCCLVFHPMFVSTATHQHLFLAHRTYFLVHVPTTSWLLAAGTHATFIDVCIARKADQFILDFVFQELPIYVFSRPVRGGWPQQKWLKWLVAEVWDPIAILDKFKLHNLNSRQIWIGHCNTTKDCIVYFVYKLILCHVHPSLPYITFVYGLDSTSRQAFAILQVAPQLMAWVRRCPTSPLRYCSQNRNGSSSSHHYKLQAESQISRWDQFSWANRVVMDQMKDNNKLNGEYGYSQLCCVEGEKEKERMMHNEDKTRLLTIIITISHDC